MQTFQQMKLFMFTVPSSDKLSHWEGSARACIEIPTKDAAVVRLLVIFYVSVVAWMQISMNDNDTFEAKPHQIRPNNGAYFSETD